MDGVLELFAGSASTIRFDDTTEATTAELIDDGRRIATWLASTGLRRGDRVAIQLPNGVDVVRLLLACAAGGFVAVPVNVRSSEAEAADLVTRSGARRITLDDGWRASDPIEPVGGRDDPVVVFTTSGTTSAPKMVLHRQRSIVDHALDVAERFAYTDADTVMVVMPLCGTFGLASLTGAVAGGSRIVLTDFALDRTAALISEERVTCVNGSDDMFHRLLDHGADLSSIRLAGYARFNTSLDGIVGRAAAAGACLTGLYGMSEVQALFSLRDPAGADGDRSRAGGTLVSPAADYRVVGDELELRGPSLFAGYLADGGDRIDDELTARFFDGDWFRTGDHAEVDDDRTFHYVSRLGDALRLGGFLVSPAEIEGVLTELTDVEAAEVVAVDRPAGARPVAFVIAPTGVDEGAVIAHCRARLARHKVPIRVVVLDEFPSTNGPNGRKIQKAELRRLAADAVESQP